MVDEIVTENDNTFKLVKEKLDSNNISYRLIEVFPHLHSICQQKLVKSLLKLEEQA